MKKKTISAILTALIIVLLIAITFLIIRVSMRGPQRDAEQVSLNQTTISENTSPEETEPEPTVSENTVTTVMVAIPQATNSVNVRSGPGTEYERIGSAYSNCEYEVIEILDNGWTKLDYEGQEGYISSEYLQYQNRMTSSDGTVTYGDVE